MLEQYGARVREASGTREAIAFLETERFDVLVSDLGMPQEDGLALIRRVRGSSSEFATIPAIALTAYARATDGQRAYESGYDHHVAKPVELARIIAAVARLARPKS
jgi:CheY-like chemotaxis protein